MSVEHAFAQFQEFQDITQIIKEGSGSTFTYFNSISHAAPFMIAIPLDAEAILASNYQKKPIPPHLFFNCGSGTVVDRPLVDPGDFLGNLFQDSDSFFSTPVSMNQEKVFNPSAIIGTINNVSSIFRLSKEQIARILGVARSTIYTWKTKTAKPRPQAIDRLFQLNLAALNWEQAGYADPYPYLEQPIFQGRTLMEIFQDEPLNQELIAHVGKRITNQKLLG